MKVAFITDSSCGVHPDIMKEKGIISLPLQIVLPNQDETLLDFIDAPLEKIYQNIEDGILMSTSIPPLGLIEKTFKQLKKEGYDTVFCIPINAGLSSCYNALRLAAEDAGLDYIHVDIYTTSVFQKVSIIRAKEMYEQGMDLYEIKRILQEVAKDAETFVIPNSLEQLKRGGRLTPLAATLAGLLKIKPILKIDASCDGKIDVYEKIRTMNKAMDRVVS
ncbi:MAG: DegV family protein, partial [Traorella sp.]